MIRIVRDAEGNLPEPPKFTMEEISDPVLLAHCKASEEAYRRNEAWMEAHWEEIWPLARGKTLAIAGEQAFIGDTPDEALKKAWAAHPDDVGIVCRYVSPHTGPKIYALRRGLAQRQQ